MTRRSISRAVFLAGALLGIAFTAACAHSGAPPPDPRPVAPGPAPSGTETTTLVIDTLLRQGWAEAHVAPAPTADDAEYLRRVTLDLVGRIPAVAETQQFLGDRDPHKRERLVDRLLASTDYTRHWTDVYVTLLVGRDVRQGGPARQFLAPYVSDAIARGKRWDQMTKELLTATGRLDEHGEGAFLVRQGKDAGPEGAAAASARIFLGLQIGCAQCHDHPYDDRYKQQDFYGMAAYFARAKGRREKGDGPGAIAIYDVPKGEAQMKVHDTGKQVRVSPRFLGRDLTPVLGETRREVFANAVVQSDLFAKEAVNRTWKDLFGRGLVDPWDDLGGERDPKHPPLLSRLADDFVAHGYDLRWLQRAIVLSEAYGRTSAGGGGKLDDAERLFARASVRPLSPEQLFRTLLEATGFDDVIAQRMGEEAAEKRIQQALREYVFVSGDDEMGEVTAFNGNVPQALLLFNGAVTNNGLRGKGGTFERVMREAKERTERLDLLFLAAYSRHPRPDEQQAMLAFLDQKLGARDAFEDLFHALLTSAECVTNH